MTKKVREVLENVLEKFKTGDIPQALALARFPIINVPSSKWSYLNRTLMFLSGTSDARGFKQWHAVNRKVKKRSKAIYILVPCIYKQEEDGVEKHILKGFKAAPVFKYEDTEGEILDYKQIEVPDLPLLERAEQWGISVKAIPGNYDYRGYYCSRRKEIALATDNEKTFFHELAHAGHEKAMGHLKDGQDPFQEIVAELSAQTLCRLVGKTTKDTLGNSYQYIAGYAKKLKLSPYTACMKVMSDTEKVLNLIVGGNKCVQEMCIPQKIEKI